MRARIGKLAPAFIVIALVGCEAPNGPTPLDPPPPTTVTAVIGCYSASAAPSTLGCRAVSSLGSPAADAVFSSEVQYQGGCRGRRSRAPRLPSTPRANIGTGVPPDQS
jgi:hypothetical protein